MCVMWLSVCTKTQLCYKIVPDMLTIWSSNILHLLYNVSLPVSTFFPTILIFFPCYPSNPYKLHLPECKTESCHIHFWTKVLMFLPTFFGRSVFLCISYVSPSAYVCVCEWKSESVLMLSAWVNAFTQPPAVHAGTLQDDATAISVNKNRSCLGRGHQNHEVQCRRLYKNMN